MRAVFGLVLILGVALAGFAVFMARGILNQNAAELARARAAVHVVPTVKVYVASKKLKYGDVLTKKDVGWIKWPKEAVPATAFTDYKALFPDGDHQQRVVLRAMDKFEPVLTVAVTKPGQDAGITSRLSSGMRAFAIRVDVASGVSGFLKPGDHVDVYWTGRSPEAHTDVTRLIDPGVKVIAVDQTANASVSTAAIIARTVTVEASPQQVATLAQAQATGKLALSLVGTQDNTVASAVEVNQNSLLGITAQAPAPVAPKKKVCTVKQRTGSKVVEVPIPCTD
jgi:pilus assembly protein CpaB